jgi:hypothetical protein
MELILDKIILITNKSYDYILIEDLVTELIINHKILMEPYKIKKEILMYLIDRVNIPFQKQYKSKVIGIYNKRAYTGILWQDSTKNKKIESKKHKTFHLYRHFDLIDLLSNEIKRENFLNIIDSKISKNEMNWPPLNIIFYQRVLFENLKKQISYDITLIEFDFINYIKNNIIYTGLENDKLNVNYFILKFSNKLDFITISKLSKILDIYILNVICKSNLDMYNKIYSEIINNEVIYTCIKNKNDIN